MGLRVRSDWSVHCSLSYVQSFLDELRRFVALFCLAEFPAGCAIVPVLCSLLHAPLPTSCIDLPVHSWTLSCLRARVDELRRFVGASFSFAHDSLERIYISRAWIKK